MMGPLAAQDDNGRYSMTPTPDGFLKLDSRTGAVSECRRGVEGYQCRLVADERSALQAEIDRLERDNAELKDRVAGTGASPAPGSGTPPEGRSTSPSEDEVDRALGVMEKFLRRFMTILREEPGKPI